MEGACLVLLWEQRRDGAGDVGAVLWQVCSKPSSPHIRAKGTNRNSMLDWDRRLKPCVATPRHASR